LAEPNRRHFAALRPQNSTQLSISCHRAR